MTYHNPFAKLNLSERKTQAGKGCIIAKYAHFVEVNIHSPITEIFVLITFFRRREYRVT